MTTTHDGDAARAALRALTCIDYFTDIEHALTWIDAHMRMPVTGPKAELGLTDYDVPLGDALDQMLADARNRYVNGPPEGEPEGGWPMSEHELAFEKGTIDRLRQIAENAGHVVDYATRIADLLQEPYDYDPTAAELAEGGAQ